MDSAQAYAALARLGSREAFELCLKYPPSLRTDALRALLPTFGESLRLHPEAAEVLLLARDASPLEGRVLFAQSVFQSAGTSMLAVLHRALASTNQVIRSNAARACGGIADPASIPHLLNALDAASGLARVSIVRALGEWKAKAALPRLSQLYTDARDEEQNRRAGSVLLAQQATFATSPYISLRGLDAIAPDWEELKRAARPQLANARRDEERLRADEVRDALRKIDATAAPKL